MKRYLFSVYDAKAEEYKEPFPSVNAATAIREFQSVCENPQHVFHTHAEDFSLHQVGGWETDSGELLDEPNKSLITATELKNMALVQSAGEA